jgi:hypothetical protein
MHYPLIAQYAIALHSHLCIALSTLHLAHGATLMTQLLAAPLAQ